MVFGQTDSLKQALDARDGLQPNFLTNNTMTDMMASVQDEPLWSILDQKGTQTMMRSLMGEASQMGDYDTIKKRILSSWYTMDFQNGVQFNLDVLTPDTFTAATMASLLNAAALYKKMSGTDIEKQAIDGTKIDSSSGKLIVSYSSSRQPVRDPAAVEPVPVCCALEQFVRIADKESRSVRAALWRLRSLRSPAINRQSFR